MILKKQETYFLLTKSSRDVNGHFTICLYGVSSKGQPVKCSIDTFQPLFFISRNTPDELTKTAAERKQLPLTAFNGTPVDCLYFQTYSAQALCAKFLSSQGIRTYESDIHPLDRFLMERMVCGGFSAEGTAEQVNNLIIYTNPKIRGAPIDLSLQVLSLDIETNTADNSLYSIACSGKKDIVFIIGEEKNTVLTRFCRDERTLLRAWIEHIRQEDPDCIIGWNIIPFDIPIIKKRCDTLKIPFEIGRDKGCSVDQNQNTKQIYVTIPGRVVIDVPVMLRANHLTFESMSLNYVANQVLGKSKIITQTGMDKINEINRLFRENKQRLAEYNLQDALLTKEIISKTHILPNASERSKLSGRMLDEYGGSIASFDYLYLPRLHRNGSVAKNTSDVPAPTTPLSGGYVIQPQPGIHENVLLFDFKSLYPTIIMTFCIDPSGFVNKTVDMIKNPAGTLFSRDKSILPGIIAELMTARQSAKQTKNQPLSYAIKILMNSFYGVLGSPACRFFSPELSQAITGTGQYILKTTCAYIEKTFSHSIVYGDTDSLFLLLGPGMDTQAHSIGTAIVSDVNNWLKKHIKEQFNTDSALELEFEEHFRHFFMPSIRGSTQGSKKRYCGTIEKDGKLILTFKGLESVRSDWTPLAKEFQNILYEKVFKNEPVEEYIIETIRRVQKGELDDKLIYRKQLRKPVHEYTSHIPQHVQAAKLLEKPGTIVRYFITTLGPQPIEKHTAPLDYDHYITVQLKPIADSILEWIGKKFDAIISGQQDLFEDDK